MSICCGNYSNVHVPHDRMYLFGNCCRMAHLMSNTHELPEVGLQRLRTHIALQFVPHVLCAGHWSVRRLFVTSITCVLLAAWRGVLSFVNIITRLKRIWGKRTRPMTSFGCHIAFMFPWMRTVMFCVHGSASVMLIFAILDVCHTILSTKNTFLPKNDYYFAVHEMPEHIDMFAPTVPHGWFCT